MNTPLKPRQALLVGYHNSPKALFIDIALYVGLMFLIREVYFQQVNFIANGLFWSFSTLVLASIFMHLRGVSWQDMGLCRPQSVKQALLATVFIFAFTIISILIFQTLKAHLGLQIAPDRSSQQAASKFGDLAGNWSLFFSIMPFIWLQSMLEEILERGFLLNWIEKALSNTWYATVIAVLAQAMLFGFRHSYDLSERSITVGLIGLAMGLGYLCFGRNLWPLILAHCLLNTMSMLDRV